MTDDEIIAELVAEAVGTLHTWIDGYTDTWPDGAQRRVRIIKVIDDSITLHLTQTDTDVDEGKFTITLKGSR